MSIPVELENSRSWSRVKRDKCGSISRVRRYEKSLLRDGYAVRSILVASLTLSNREGGKGAVCIYRDGIIRVRRRQRRPDNFNLPEELGDL